jgi:hypothetical protein
MKSNTYNVYKDSKVVATYAQPTAHFTLKEIIARRKNARRNARLAHLLTK